MNTKIKNDVNTYYLNYLSNKYCESGKAGSFLLKTNTTELFTKGRQKDDNPYRVNILFNDPSKE